MSVSEKSTVCSKVMALFIGEAYLRLKKFFGKCLGPYWIANNCSREGFAWVLQSSMSWVMGGNALFNA